MSFVWAQDLWYKPSYGLYLEFLTSKRSDDKFCSTAMPSFSSGFFESLTLTPYFLTKLCSSFKSLPYITGSSGTTILDFYSFYIVSLSANLTWYEIYRYLDIILLWEYEFIWFFLSKRPLAESPKEIEEFLSPIDLLESLVFMPLLMWFLPVTEHTDPSKVWYGSSWSKAWGLFVSSTFNECTNYLWRCSITPASIDLMTLFHAFFYLSYLFRALVSLVL
jgi:hypothetical protein